jgi:hypothetical protein
VLRTSFWRTLSLNERDLVAGGSRRSTQNERLVWSAASSNGNAEDGRGADGSVG